MIHLPKPAREMVAPGVHGICLCLDMKFLMCHYFLSSQKVTAHEVDGQED